MGSVSRCAVALLISAFSSPISPGHARTPAAKVVHDEQLQFVVYLTRHGVRSPTGQPGRYDAYSAAPWPKWNVKPGYLTAHGFELMKLFGAYDRKELAGEGLLAPTGCGDAAHVNIVADSDERTRETGRALAEGMYPGCHVAVHARPENDIDPLFHSMRAGVDEPNRALKLSAIEGRIGGSAANLTEAYHPQLEVLDRILAGCGRVAPTNRKRISIFDAPLSDGRHAHRDELHGPLNVGASMAETLLLEYTNGLKGAELGWGCLNQGNLREIMQLHEVHEDLSDRTPVIARMKASNLLDHILKAMEQSAAAKPIVGAPGRFDDRVLFLVGHDTNIAAVAGMLHLGWILDGRRNDTPPGGALVFELWHAPEGDYSVRVYYTAQTLLQMRESSPYTPADIPQRVPIFVQGCSRADMSCPLDGFAAAARHALDPAFAFTPKQRLQ